MSQSRGQYHVFYGTSLYTLRPNRDELFDELEVVEFSLPSDIDALIRSKRAAESGPASKLEMLEEPISAGSNFLEVGWRAPVRALDKIDHFKLLMSSSSGVVKDVCQGKFDHFKVPHLRPSTEYVFCVKARSALDMSSHHTVSSILPALFSSLGASVPLRMLARAAAKRQPTEAACMLSLYPQMVFDDGTHMWSESRAYSTRFGGANVTAPLGSTAKKGTTGAPLALTAA